MIALVKNLTSKEPYYVRCIKPNDQKSPVLFDEERVRHQVMFFSKTFRANLGFNTCFPLSFQVSYLGLIENVRVRRAGFAYRQSYDRFLRRLADRKLNSVEKTPLRSFFFCVKFRYKMVSQYTWPNFRGGSDREGVRILIQQQNFEDDVVYGKTKIFVRSPQTLFMLEQVSETKSLCIARVSF